MSDMVFELVKVAVMLAALVAARYIIPWVKDRMGENQLEQVTRWVKSAVLYAQQTMWSESGAERKKTVERIVWEMLADHNIKITEEQLDILIEAAVKEMKISENAGIVIQTSNDDLPDGPDMGGQADQDGTQPYNTTPQGA